MTLFKCSHSCPWTGACNCVCRHQGSAIGTSRRRFLRAVAGWNGAPIPWWPCLTIPSVLGVCTNSAPWDPKLHTQPKQRLCPSHSNPKGKSEAHSWRGDVGASLQRARSGTTDLVQKDPECRSGNPPFCTAWARRQQSSWEGGSSGTDRRSPSSNPPGKEQSHKVREVHFYGAALVLCPLGHIYSEVCRQHVYQWKHINMTLIPNVRIKSNCIEDTISCFDNWSIHTIQLGWKWSVTIVRVK